MQSIPSRFPSAGAGLLTVALALCAGLTTPGAEPAADGLSFAASTADAGEVYQFAVLEHAFIVDNPTGRDIVIAAVEAAVPPGEAEPRPATVPAGGTGRIVVRQPVGPRLGEAAFRFTVRTGEGATHELVLDAFVQSAYDTELPFLDFADVVRDRGRRLPLEIASREVDRVELVEVVSAPDFVTVEPDGRTGVADEGVRVAVGLTPGAPVGLQFGVLHLRTDVAHHPDYLVRFRASVFGDVVPEQSPLNLGVVRVGQPFSVGLRLGSRSGSRFTVGAVRDARGWLEARAEPCGGGRGPSDCWQVTVGQTPVRPGRLDGVLEAEVGGRLLPLAYTGLVARPGATVRDLGEVGGRSEPVRVDSDGTEEDRP